MSLIDPAVSRNESLRKQQGQQRMLTLGLTALAIIGIAALASGAAMSALFDEMRHGTIDSIFDDRQTLIEGHMFLLPAGVTFGIMGVLGGVALYVWAITRYLGGETPWLLPAPVGVVGFTIGYTALVPAWTGPLEVGKRVDPSFGHDRDWGWGSWILYSSAVWVPLLLLAISAVVVLWAKRTSQARVALRAERDRLLVEGMRVPGDATEVRVHMSNDDTGSSRPAGATVTVRYLDAQSRPRWVERFTRSTELQVGPAAVEVLFDPLRPDEAKSVFVAFRREPLPSDWIGPKQA